MKRPRLIPNQGYIDVWRHKETGRLRVERYRNEDEQIGKEMPRTEDLILTTLVEREDEHCYQGWMIHEPGRYYHLDGTELTDAQAALVRAALNGEILEQEEKTCAASS